MAISATNITNLKNNPGHVQKLIDLFIDHANQTGNSTLSRAFAIGQNGLGGMTTPDGCTATDVITALADFVTEISS